MYIVIVILLLLLSSCQDETAPPENKKVEENKVETKKSPPLFVVYEGERFYRIDYQKTWIYPTDRTPTDANFYRQSPGSPYIGMYGWTRSQGLQFHEGVDILGDEGITPVRAAADGRVVRVDYYDNPSYGKLVIIEHSKENVLSVYAHLHSVNVKLEEEVKQGQILGKVGRTGNAKKLPRPECHVHFEVDILLNPGAPKEDRYSGTNMEGIDPIRFIEEGKIYFGRYTLSGTWAEPDGSLRQFIEQQTSLTYQGNRYAIGYIYGVWKKVSHGKQNMGYKEGMETSSRINSIPGKGAEYEGWEILQDTAVLSLYEVYHNGKRLRIKKEGDNKGTILVRTIEFQ